MTNEEKTEEILEIVRKSVIPRYQDGDYKDNYFDEVKECCLEMARWKDEQIISLLPQIITCIYQGFTQCASDEVIIKNLINLINQKENYES